MYGGNHVYPRMRKGKLYKQIRKKYIANPQNFVFIEYLACPNLYIFVLTFLTFVEIF